MKFTTSPKEQQVTYELILRNFASGSVSKIDQTSADEELLRMIARARNEREGRDLSRNVRWSVRAK